MDVTFLRSIERKVRKDIIRNGIFREEFGIQNLLVYLLKKNYPLGILIFVTEKVCSRMTSSAVFCQYLFVHIF